MDPGSSTPEGPLVPLKWRQARVLKGREGCKGLAHTPGKGQEGALSRPSHRDPLSHLEGQPRCRGFWLEVLIRCAHEPSYQAGHRIHSRPSLQPLGLVPNRKEFSGIKQMWGMEEELTAKLIIRNGKMRFFLRWGRKSWDPIELPTWLEAPQRGIL